MNYDNLEPTVLYTDDSLLVINKPAGLLSIPDGYNADLPFVTRLLEPRYGRLWVVHRLDRETSGVLLLARSAEAHRGLNLQFDRHQVAKTYHALVEGSVEKDWQRIDFSLRMNVGSKHRTVVDPVGGRPAITEVEVMNRFSGCTLIAAHPRTGYTHQIRAHLYAVHHPILFDPLYGPGRSDNLPDLGSNPARLALHAFRIAFLHPVTGESTIFEAPYPDDFQKMLDWVKELKSAP